MCTFNTSIVQMVGLYEEDEWPKADPNDPKFCAYRVVAKQRQWGGQIDGACATWFLRKLTQICASPRKCMPTYTEPSRKTVTMLAIPQALASLVMKIDHFACTVSYRAAYRNHITIHLPLSRSPRSFFGSTWFCHKKMNGLRPPDRPLFFYLYLCLLVHKKNFRRNSVHAIIGRYMLLYLMPREPVLYETWYICRID